MAHDLNIPTIAERYCVEFSVTLPAEKSTE